MVAEELVVRDFSEHCEFEDRDSGFTALQINGFKLWQWLDHVTTVWWGPGRRRVLVQEMEDGTVKVDPLPSLAWQDVKDRVGTIANVRQVKDLRAGA